MILKQYNDFIRSININGILTTTVSIDGYKCIKKLGFNEVKKLKENETLFSFNIEEGM